MNKTNQERDLLTGNLQEDFQEIKNRFDRSSDFCCREFEINTAHKAVILFIDGLVNKDRIDSMY